MKETNIFFLISLFLTRKLSGEWQVVTWDLTGDAGVARPGMQVSSPRYKTLV